MTTLEDLNNRSSMLEMLYDGCYDRIYAYCVHRLFCRTAAEDVTSEVFLSVAKGIGSINDDGQDAHVRWLYGIAVNQCNSYIRKNLRRRKLFEKFRQEHCHHQNSRLSVPDWTNVYSAIAQLKEIEQTVITLRFFEKMEYQDIASIINKHPNAVRAILHRGLKKLQKSLNTAVCGFENRGVGHG